MYLSFRKLNTFLVNFCPYGPFSFPNLYFSVPDNTIFIPLSRSSCRLHFYRICILAIFNVLYTLPNLYFSSRLKYIFGNITYPLFSSFSSLARNFSSPGNRHPHFYRICIFYILRGLYCLITFTKFVFINTFYTLYYLPNLYLSF